MLSKKDRNSPEAAWFIEVTIPDGTSFAHTVEDGDLSIGRARDNQLQLPDESLSRHHAMVRCRDRQLTVEDLGSRNGSYLNGAALTEALPISQGDRLQVGATELHFKRHAPVSFEGTEGARVANATAVFDVTGINRDVPARGQFHDVEEENRALSLLTRAGRMLIAHRPIEETLDEILELARDGLGAERGAIALLDDAASEPSLAIARDSDGPADLQLSRTVAGTVFEEKTAVCVVDVAHDPRVASSQSVVLQGVNSLICAPLWNGNTVSGLFYLDRRIGNGGYEESDLKLLSMLANVVAVKVENARLIEESLARQRLEEELAVASRIQRRLLPRDVKQVPGLSFRGECRACTEVGGDFYDHFETSDGGHAFVVADVCGKGVGGALLAASLQASLRGGANFPLEPSARIAWVNGFIHDLTPVDRYITAVYLEFPADRASFSYVSAGHPPILVLRADGSVESHREGGMPLGLFPDAEYESGTVSLAPGDRLFLVTDGVTEAAPAGVREPQFGEDKLLSSALPHLGDTEAASEAIFAALAEFTGGAPLLDDATLVIVERPRT